MTDLNFSETDLMYGSKRDYLESGSENFFLLMSER